MLKGAINNQDLIMQLKFLRKKKELFEIIGSAVKPMPLGLGYKVETIQA